MSGNRRGEAVKEKFDNPTHTTAPAMIIKLPSSVRFPITITEFLKEANTEVARLEPLFVYTYKTKVTVYPEYGVELLVEKKLSSQFDAPIGGKLARWMVAIGTVVENSRFVTWSAGTGSRGSRRRADRAVIVCRSSRLMSHVRTKSNSPDYVRCVART